MSGVQVVVEDLSNHPCCPHGPTILFSRKIAGEQRNFYACSACRDRKDCSFFLYQDELERYSEEKRRIWSVESRKFLKNINHKRLFLKFNQVRNLPPNHRIYCQTCSCLDSINNLDKHKDHDLIKNITDHQLEHPTEWLQLLENPKKEAQYLFSQSSSRILIGILKKLQLKHIICMGTPRLHEFIQNYCNDMTSILLDIDDRYHNFYGPLQFCWYNSFNNHFFLPESQQIFHDFLQTSNGKQLALILDPPFGGRVEPLAQTLQIINDNYKNLNKIKIDLPIFWIFPYFMEPQIINSLPDFTMLDYKVDYDNHPLFQDGPKGRKYGSPVRIFTNISPSKIELPEDEGYCFCNLCQRWVYKDNKHCQLCNKCTSKDGRTYQHCNICNRCVKPTWIHCNDCKRCTQPDHKCGEIEFEQACFHCKQSGHKKRDCPQVDHIKLQQKRKLKQLRCKDEKRKRLK